MRAIPADAGGVTFEPLGYVDSIFVLSPMPLRPTMKQRLRSYVRHGLIGKLFVGRSRGKHRAETLVGFHQPSPEFIPVLDEMIEREGWQLFSVHVALDLLVNSRRDSEVLGRFVTARLVQRFRHMGKPVVEYKTCTYLCERTAPRNITVYADRKSKCSGRFACHIEVRFRRMATLRRVGIIRALDILTCNISAIFRKVMALEELDFRKLGRLATGRGHAKKPSVYRFGRFEYDRDLRTGQNIIRHWEACMSDHRVKRVPVATLARSACAFFGIRPERVLRKLDLSLILPLPLMIERSSPVDAAPMVPPTVTSDRIKGTSPSLSQRPPSEFHNAEGDRRTVDIPPQRRSVREFLYGGAVSDSTSVRYTQTGNDGVPSLPSGKRKDSGKPVEQLGCKADRCSGTS